MKTIRFHRVDNSGWGRYHGIWFKKFAKYLEKYFIIDWKDYYDPSNQMASSRLEMQSDIGSFGKNPPLSDVDCVIENLETKQFIVLTFTEYFNSYVVHYLKSPYCQKLLTAHYSNQNTYYWLKRDDVVHQLEKVSPWFFGSMQEWDVEKYRNIRDSIDPSEYVDSLFWKGSGIGSYRKVIEVLSEKGALDTQTVDFDSYMIMLSKQKLALSYYMDLDRYNTPYDYPGEFCYRDMEYCALGIPFIRIEYKDNVYEGLYPNKHYISIPREKAYIAYEKDGNEGVANLIIDKFNDIKNDDKLLSYISKNQRAWFDKYALWPNSAEFAIKLTGVDKWI